MSINPLLITTAPEKYETALPSVKRYIRPSRLSDDAEERRLAILMHKYIDSADVDFDPDFSDWIEKYSKER